MSDLNYVCLLGRLCADPELSYTPTGTAVAKARIACNSKYLNAQQKEVDDTLFINFSVWKKQAETFTQYMKKGSKILLTGKLKLDSWTAQDGTKKTRISITANRVIFLDNKGTGQRPDPGEDASPDDGAGKPAPLQPVPPGAEEQESPDIKEEDIPF